LVEDNPGDALLVTERLEEARPEHYRVTLATSLSEAIHLLRSLLIEVILLDLSLPDGSGADGVTRLREEAPEIPIVVLTGSDDEGLAEACLRAGAEDFLSKHDDHPRSLHRSIGYAISRVRDHQVRRLEEVLAHYRALSSKTQGTTITAAMVGSGAVSTRNPAAFDTLVRLYFALFSQYVGQDSDRLGLAREDKERIITTLGDLNGGPRDLIDIHVAALDRATSLSDQPRSRTLVYEARLLALEMMGLLVDYYRVGHRRRFSQGAGP
jgi:CheY-like chemotaxis protein